MAARALWGSRHFISKDQTKTVLAGAIDQLDPDMIQKKQWLTRLKMRNQLGIKDFVNDEYFQWHGRLIPPGLLSSKTAKTQGPYSFKPGEKKGYYYSISKATNDPLINLKKVEECFFSCDDRINFRARDGKLLHHLARSELRGRKLELYSHERQFQPQKDSPRTSTSVASSDGESGTRKRQAAKSKKLKAKRVKRSNSQPNTDDEDLDGNQQKPLADNSRCRWSVEEKKRKKE